MQKLKKTDLLHKSRLTALHANYRTLIDSISGEELGTNKRLRHEIRKVRRQLQMIEELSDSFQL